MKKRIEGFVINLTWRYAIKDFYDGENFEPLEPTSGTYIDKLEFDMEYVRLI